MPLDQPSLPTYATEEATKDADVNVDVETTVESWIAMMIRDTPALTANWTITLPKTVAFSNHSTAEIEMTKYATIVENPVTYGPNAAHAKTALKPKTMSKNETTTQS